MQPKKRRPAIALILSILTPGLGQFYNGQATKGGFLYVFATIVPLVMVFSGLLLKFSGLLILVVFCLAFYIYLIFDAMRFSSKDTVAEPGRLNRWYVYLIIFILAVIVSSVGNRLVFNVLRIKPYKVPSRSMEKTLLVGDYFFVDKKSYKYNKPQRGDIIVFRSLNEDTDYVKRIVAVGGDSVELKANVTYINGKRVESSFAVFSNGSNAVTGPIRDLGPLSVPQGEIFVMGDNRDNSFDSRYFGTLKESRIVGKALYIYWSRRIGRIGINLS